MSVGWVGRPMHFESVLSDVIVRRGMSGKGGEDDGIASNRLKGGRAKEIVFKV